MNTNEVELCRPEFTLLVAGNRGGKTSFLRLLLDTSDIAPNATKDDLASLAKFVHGCSGPTTYFRSTSVDIDSDSGRALGLTLIDSPSLDFTDESGTERTIADILGLIESRFLEAPDDDRKAHSGDRHVHLCIYFLDPDAIVPPAASRPPAPLVPRTRTNSFSQPEHEPVILEPPVTTNPLMFRPTLPPADIATIRRLSARVNVLPVIARADLLSNERLAAVKLAVRRDLADAGIGFGIFDMDAAASATTSNPHSPEDPKLSAPPDPSNSSASNGYPSTAGHLNGGSNSTASATTSPPTSPVSPSIMRLPYALVSPDIYSHSEGVPRVPPPRHELVQQYTPTHPSAKSSRRGKFLRYYRWGNLDVLDPAHCDFVPLRNAIFHHMETLQKYTREYLFEKFRSDYIQLQQQQQQRPPSRLSSHPHPHSHPHSHPHAHSPHAISHLTHPHPIGHMAGLAPHPARPILAIDTQPPPQHPPPQGLHHPQPLPSMSRHPQPGVPPIPASSRDILSGVSDGRTPGSSTSARASPGQLNTNKQRSKKITVACNFCRSRKLKCDGGRPACSQCLKRSNPCDYAPQNKRRNTIRTPRRTDIPGSSSTRPGEEDDDSATGDREPPPPLAASSHQQNALPPSSSLTHGALGSGSSVASIGSGGGRSVNSYFPPPDNDLPHIATLSLPDSSSPSTPVPMSAPSLPPIRPASEQQAAQRKRAATVPGKTGGTGRGSGSGPKVVACNSCRARKTKCDGAHPACASCARRQVPCLYVHDMNGNNNNGGNAAIRDPNNGSTSSTLKKRRASASIHQPPPPSQRPPTSSSTPTRGAGGGYISKDDEGSSRSLSPPSSRVLATPSTAGTPGGPPPDLLDRHMVVGHHRSYSSFRSSGGRGSDDGIIDDRDDRIDHRDLGYDRDRLERREMEMDLKRPLPMEHLDRDVDMRSLHDDDRGGGGVHHSHHSHHVDMRAVKKMRMEDSVSGPGAAPPVGGIPR
ncbi:Septin-1 [Leucoagaricus sp. SymC.cos]|nr:Septin-1 [Leucoagaricus sp. SymC.cos]